MRRVQNRHWLRSIATALALAGVGATAGASTRDLPHFLVGPREEPGYTPVGAVQIVTSFRQEASLRGVGNKGAERLRREGFAESAHRGLSGPSGATGVTSVIEFGSARSAKQDRDMRLAVAPKQFAPLKITPFMVPGVPTARGYTATHRGTRIANVLWTEGRCELTLGNISSGGVDLRTVQRDAVRAIEHRTHGRCP